MLKQRASAAAALGILLCLALGACSERRAEAETLRLGIAPVSAYGLLFVAEDHDLYRQEGVVVTTEVFATGRAMLEPLVAGKLDLATVYTTPTLHAKLSGVDLVAVAGLHRAERTTALLARRSHGIGNAEDLPGKRIGTTERTSADFFLSVFLAESGLQRSQLKIEEGAQAALKERLLRGELDGVTLWSPGLLSTIRELGEDAVVLHSESYQERGLAIGMRPRIEQKRVAVERFLAALWRAQKLVEANPKLLAESLAKHLPGVTAADVDAIIAGSHCELGISHRLLSGLRQEAVWLEEGGVERKPDVEIRDLLLPGPLRKVAPETVTLPSVDELAPRR